MDTAKKVILGILGFVLGVVFLGLFITGATFTAAGIAANLVFSPQTADWAEQISDGSEIGSLEKEFSRFLQGTEIGRQIILEEQDVNRVLSAAVASLSEEEAKVDYMAVNLSPGYMEFLGSLSVTIPQDKDSPVHLRPFTTTIRGGFFVETEDNELLLEVDFLEAGRLPLPVGFFHAAAEDGSIFPPDSPVRVLSSTPVTLGIPLKIVEEELPSMIGLRGLRVIKDALQVDLILKTAAAEKVIQKAAPLFEEQGSEFKTALEKTIEAGVDQEKLEPAIKASQQLVSLSRQKEPQAPHEPSAFVSFLVNEVIVNPQEGASFTPRIGDDLFKGSTISTETASYAELILRDKSVIKIAEETTFRLVEIPQREEASTTVLDLVSGKLRAKVTKAISEDSGFEVHTKSVVMGVRGTDLVVHFEEDKKLVLLVLEGKVTLAPPSGPETTVEQGERTEAGSRDLKKGIQGALPKEKLTEKDIKEVEREVPVTTTHEDEAIMRKEVSYLEVIDQIKEIAAVVMALEPEEQELLGKQVKSFVNLKEAERRFNELKQYPEFEELMTSLGVEEFPSP